jgi:hypothetical protein
MLSFSNAYKKLLPYSVATAILYKYSRDVRIRYRYETYFADSYIREKSLMWVANPNFAAADDNRVCIEEYDIIAKREAEMQTESFIASLTDQKNLRLGICEVLGLALVCPPLLLISIGAREYDDRQIIYKYTPDDLCLEFQKWKVIKKVKCLPDIKHVEYANRALDHVDKAFPKEIQN